MGRWEKLVDYWVERGGDPWAEKFLRASLEAGGVPVHLEGNMSCQEVTFGDPSRSWKALCGTRAPPFPGVRLPQERRNDGGGW
jgi:hypothetical protein